MNRRRFLAWLGGTTAGVAAAHVLDVERLLWVAGEKTIFMPPQRATWLTRGDIFTIEGFHAINPMTRRETGFLQHFVVTADVYYDEPTIEASRIAPNLQVIRPLWGPDVDTRYMRPSWVGQTIPMQVTAAA